MWRSVSIAVLTATLLFGAGTITTGTKNVLASAQQKPETTEVKIDNFSFGPATLTVPVGPIATIFRTRWSARTGSLNPKYLIRTKSFPLRSAKRERIRTSARFTQR